MKKIKFLSYNILQKPVGIVEEGKNEYKTARMELLTIKIKDYDIICFQESFDFLNYRTHNFLKKLEKLGFKYFLRHNSTKFTKFQSLDSGLMIISKFPIVDSEKKIFTVGVYNDGLVDKGMLYAKIEIRKNKFIHVINIHTQAIYMYKPLDFKYCCFFKNLVQMIDIKTFLKEKLKNISDEDLVLMGGDFNIEVNKLIEEDFRKFFNFIDYDRKLLNFNKLKTKFEYLESIFNYKNDIFSLNHLYMDHHNEHAITFGKLIKNDSGINIPNEIVLTRKDEREDNSSLDHIFEVKKFNKKKKSFFKIVDKSAAIEEFFVKDDQYVFTQLSDHFGLSCEISFSDKY